MSPSPARILSVALLLSTVFASLGTSAIAQGTGGASGGNAATNNGPRSNVEIVKHWSMTAIGKQGAALLDTSMPGGKEQLKQGSIGQGGGEAQPEKIKCSDLGDGSCQWYDKNAGIPASAAEIPCSSKGCAGQTKSNSPHGLKGERASDTSTYTAMAAVAADEVANMLNPEAQAKIAQAEMQAQAQSAGNSCGEVEHNQSASAIDFCGKYLENFTVQGGNKWNQIRDHIFVPIGILLLLPGAVLTQVKAIVAAGTPVVQPMNPFEGILRSIVAVFLIPCTYLVINYGIDVANSITYTINSEYTRLFGSDMYRDAICAQLRAFPVRQPSENRNAYDLPTAVMGQALMGGTTPFAKLEATLYANKIDDPCAGLYILPQDRADEALPSSAIMAKLASNASNMALTTTWNILCAFQMAYLYYLWCVGPVVAGLWVWPMKQLRDALPSWVEGVITLCFWSLFWNTTVLLMACFRGVDETGTIIMSALNFLSTACVKFAFDFAGLVRAAGQEAAKMAEQAMEAAKGGGGGGGGGGASAGKGGGQSAGSSGASAGSTGGSAKSASNFAGGGVKPGVGTGHGITAGSSRSVGGPGSSLVSDTSSSTGVTSSSHALGMDSSTVSPPPTGADSTTFLAGTSGSDGLTGGAGNDGLTGGAGGDTYFGVGDSPINTPDSPSLLADMGLPPSSADSVSFSSSSFGFTDASTSNFNFMDGGVSLSGGHGGSEAFLAGGAALSMSGFGGAHGDRSGDTHHNLFGADNNWSNVAQHANHDWTTNNAWNQTTNVDASTQAMADAAQTNAGLANFDNLLGTDFNQNVPLVQPDSSTLASSDITNASPTDIGAPVQGDNANNYYNSATYDASQQVTAYDQQQQAAAAQASEQQQQFAQQQQAAAQELMQQQQLQQQAEQIQQQQQFAQQNNVVSEQYAAQGVDGQVIGSASSVSPDVSSFVNTDSGSIQMNSDSIQMNSVPGAPASEPAVSFSAPEITSNSGASAVSESYSYVSSDSTQQVIGGSDYLMSDATQASTSSTFADTATNSVVSYTDNTQFGGTPDSPSYVNPGATSSSEYVQGGDQSVTNNVAYAGESVISANTAGSFDTSTVNNVSGDTSTSYNNVDSSYVTSYTSGDGTISYSRDASALGYTGDNSSVSGYPASDYNTVSYTSQDTSGNVVSAGFVNAESGANVISTNTVNAEGFAAPGQETIATGSPSATYTQDVYASASASQDAIVSGAPDASAYGASSSTQEYISQSINNQVGYAGESVISAGTADAQTNYSYDSSSTQAQYTSYSQGASDAGSSVNISLGEGTTGNISQTGYIDAPVSGVYERPSNDSASVDYQSMPWNFGPGGESSYPTITSVSSDNYQGGTSTPAQTYESSSQAGSGTTYEGSGYTAASLSEQGPSVFTQTNYGTTTESGSGSTGDLYQASAGYATPIASGAGYTQAAYESTSASPSFQANESSSYQMSESAGATAGSSVGSAAGSEFIQASYSGNTGSSAPAINYSEPSVDAGNSYVPAIGAGFVQAAEPSVTYSNPTYAGSTYESTGATVLQSGSGSEVAGAGVQTTGYDASGSPAAFGSQTANYESSGPLTPTPNYDSTPSYTTAGSGEATVPAPAPNYAANQDSTAPSTPSYAAPTYDSSAIHSEARPGGTYAQGGTEASYQPGTTDATPSFSTQPASDTLVNGIPQQSPQQDPTPALPIDSNQPGLVLAPITNESARPIPDGNLQAGTASGGSHPSGYDAPVQYYQHLADNSAGLAAELAAPHFTVSAETYERAANVEPIHDYGHAVHGTEPHVTITASDHQVQEAVQEACVNQKVSVFTAAMGAAAVTRVATEQQHMKPAAPAPSEVTVSSAMPAQQTRGISLLARALGPAVSKKKLEPVAPPPMHDPSSST